MNLSDHESQSEPTRSEIDALEGSVVIEFGASWCGHCKAARPLIVSALVNHPRVGHIKFEDGPGCLLGRSFRVKLWPTLVFMQQGKEAARLVRPVDSDEIERELMRIDSAP